MLFARLFVLCRCAAKLGFTSVMKIEMAFYFAFRSVCTNFDSAEGTDARKRPNNFWLFARLFVL